MNRIKVRRKEVFQGLLCAAILVCLATGIGWMFRLLQFPETNIVVVYILSRHPDSQIYGRIHLGYSGNGAFNLCLQYLFYTAVLYDVCG